MRMRGKAWRTGGARDAPDRCKRVTAAAQRHRLPPPPPAAVAQRPARAGEAGSARTVVERERPDGEDVLARDAYDLAAIELDLVNHDRHEAREHLAERLAVRLRRQLRKRVHAAQGDTERDALERDRAAALAR
eukprot:5089048-Prymnesium_polylepis.1